MDHPLKFASLLEPSSRALRKSWLHWDRAIARAMSDSRRAQAREWRLVAWIVRRQCQASQVPQETPPKINQQAFERRPSSKLSQSPTTFPRPPTQPPARLREGEFLLLN